MSSPFFLFVSVSGSRRPGSLPVSVSVVVVVAPTVGRGVPYRNRTGSGSRVAID